MIAPRSLAWHERDGLWLALLALASAWFLASNFQFVQRAAIPGLDEGIYFFNGRGLWSGQAPQWAWSPAFAPLYALFAFPGAREDLAVPALHLVLQSAAMLLFYQYVRAWLAPWAAAAFAVALGFSPYLLPTFNVYGFCQLWVLACLLGLRSRPRWGLALLALGPWVRGEYAVFSGAALAAAFLWRLFPRRDVLAAFVLLALGAAFILPQGASRSTLTFAHHYAWAAAEQGKGHPDHWTHWEEPLRRDFGASDLSAKLSGYAKANPAAFKAYLLHNASRSIGNFWESHNFWLFPANQDFKSTRSKPLLLALLASITLGLWLALKGRPRPVVPAPAFPPELWMGLAGLLALMLGPWILFRPQHEYFAALRPITLGAAAWACPLIAARAWDLACRLRSAA